MPELRIVFLNPSVLNFLIVVATPNTIEYAAINNSTNTNNINMKFIILSLYLSKLLVINPSRERSSITFSNLFSNARMCVPPIIPHIRLSTKVKAS